MIPETEDMALAALLAAGHQAAPHMHADTLRKAYEIERLSQFDDTRDGALKNLQKMIDELVNSGAVS